MKSAVTFAGGFHRPARGDKGGIHWALCIAKHLPQFAYRRRAAQHENVTGAPSDHRLTDLQMDRFPNECHPVEEGSLVANYSRHFAAKAGADSNERLKKLRRLRGSSFDAQLSWTVICWSFRRVCCSRVVFSTSEQERFKTEEGALNSQPCRQNHVPFENLMNVSRRAVSGCAKTEPASINGPWSVWTVSEQTPTCS